MKHHQYNKRRYSSKLHIFKYMLLGLCIILIVAGAVFFINVYRVRYFHLPSPLFQHLRKEKCLPVKEQCFLSFLSVLFGFYESIMWN